MANPKILLTLTKQQYEQRKQEAKALVILETKQGKWTTQKSRPAQKRTILFGKTNTQDQTTSYGKTK